MFPDFFKKFKIYIGSVGWSGITGRVNSWGGVVGSVDLWGSSDSDGGLSIGLKLVQKYIISRIIKEN